MFPAASSTVDLTYDFSTRENEAKWKGIFIIGLKKVALKVGHTVRARDDALDYLERLILQLLGMICKKPSPHTVSEVQERVQSLFPPPIDKWAIDEANSFVEKYGKDRDRVFNTSAIKQGKKKVDLVFPVDKIYPLLQKDVLFHKIEINVSVYICAVLEYIAADILNLVGNYIKHTCRHAEFSRQDMKAALFCDKVLCDLFKLGDNESVSVDEEPITRNSLSYNEVVDDLLQSERQYLRDLQMLLKVFRESLANLLEKENQDLELAFSHLEGITELTITIISTVEDTLEMNEPNQIPSVGICFLELAENMEFEFYEFYAKHFNEDCKKKLDDLLSRPETIRLVYTAGHGLVEAIKFYFPKLLLEPFYHCLQYFEYIKLLYRLSQSEKDKTDLQEADSVLTSLKAILENLNIPKKATGDIFTRISGKGNKHLAQQKISEIKNQVEGFNDSIGNSYFNEFICKGELLKIGSGRKPSERYAYLFDGILFLCKSNYRRTSVTGGTQFEYRLKETYYMTKVEVRDKEDTEEWKNLFEIIPKNQQPIVLSIRTAEEKANWMAVLVMLTTKGMLDRILDRCLSDEEKKHPLQLPPESKYRFAVMDSDNNIVFDKDNGNHFIIKGATLLKLVERLTHHQYSDPNFINTFLTTYRSFSSSHEFLDLLIERFDVPEPDILPEEKETIHTREMLKRFRKEYVRLVKLRVLNVIKQWVNHHFYDFERDPSLQSRLELFLEKADEASGKNNIFESVKKVLKKAVENSNKEEMERNFSADRSPPPIEVHLRIPASEYNILTLHPIEIARQLTLLEFDLYRVVKPSELVGGVWMNKKNKEQTSPNLLKMIKHTTYVTRWFERTIVDTENLEERIAVCSRILEIMMVLQELNNFNGVLAALSAMGSASVHRLSLTFQGVSPRLIKALDEAQELQNDHYRKYQERLRSINPPCVPFFGMYLTNILHIEEGNLDFLPNSSELINFAKRRKVAEITSEIRQFQYSHYCLSVEPKIREFLEKLQPFEVDKAENEISNYLYEKSLEIEPRGAGRQPPKFARKWPDLNLKSPGIKPKHLPGRNYPGPLNPFTNLSNSTSTMSLISSPSQSTMDTDIENDNISFCESQTQTPKTLTPSSVNTSPPDDFSIFAPVLIEPSRSSSHGNYIPPLPPPPLPPRPRRDGGEISPIVSDLPPPLPPRKVSPRTPNPPVPRRNSSSINDTSNQTPLLSPNRINHNGPPPLPSHYSPRTGVSESSHSSFVFHPPPISPSRTGSIPQPLSLAKLSPPSSAAPQLPPKSTQYKS